jgi:hypothetical protein
MLVSASAILLAEMLTSRLSTWIGRGGYPISLAFGRASGREPVDMTVSLREDEQ